MAFHCRLKLPNLKLTKRTVGSKSTSIVHRGIGTTSQESVTSLESSEARNEISEGFTEDTRITEEASEPFCASSDLDFPVSDDEPTHHELQSKADVKGWEQLRNTFLVVATECSAMALGQQCVFCQNPAEFRCQECGPLLFYYKECFCSRHENINFFHVAEEWEVGLMNPCNLWKTEPIILHKIWNLYPIH